ncbi:MAG: lysophospholipid acyltransferase family protein [Desulfobacca sp.]|uniref:lysophospholipid acyltransferase family protein n=1 Tax=Desulfobacca sp. TaxID=2067990 RepID=UPI00404995B7
MERPAKSTRNLSKFCQMACSRYVSRHLPFGFAQSFVSLLGRLYFWRHPAERQLICQTIDRVFWYRPQAQRRALKHRTFQGVYRHYQEKLFLAYAPETKVQDFLRTRLAWRGARELRAALDRGRGVIVVTGHYGAVEFLPAAMGLAGYPAAVIVRPQTQALAESMAKRAALVNLTLIFPENGKVLPAALRALRQGRILITEMDEFEMWRGQKDYAVSFLGFSLPGDRTLDVLHQRSRAPLFTALVQRRPQRRYTVALQPMPAPPPGLGVGSQCLQALEQAIWSTPEQWYQWQEFGKLLATLPIQEQPEPGDGETLCHLQVPRLAQV